LAIIGVAVRSNAHKKALFYIQAINQMARDIHLSLMAIVINGFTLIGDGQIQLLIMLFIRWEELLLLE